MACVIVGAVTQHRSSRHAGVPPLRSRLSEASAAQQRSGGQTLLAQGSSQPTVCEGTVSIEVVPGVVEVEVAPRLTLAVG